MMFRYYVGLVLMIFLLKNTCVGQDMPYIKRSIFTLAGPGFGGRGYVNNSRDKAAKFLFRNFSDIGLEAFHSNDSFYQNYQFSVNTFPNSMRLKVGKKDMQPGVDFLVNASSVGFRSQEKSKLVRINLAKVKDSLAWETLKAKFQSSKIYQLNNVDSFCKKVSLRQNHFEKQLPKACYIVPQKSKLTWTVSTDTLKSTIFYLLDSVRPRSKKIEVLVKNKFLPNAVSKNLIGYVAGTEYPDSFIVFTAHYDHLGKMGDKAIFPGANDNASGTAFVLAIAKHFKEHPSKYSIAIIAFSGEEAGLLGSKFYVAHPAFPLAKIKFLINVDLMGDASDGIMVVNAKEQSSAFSSLENINKQNNYLPKIASRDNAANSDHYPFTQAGVPAIFIYALGGKGYYHDVWDKPKELSLNNIPQVFKLVTDFVQNLK